MIARSRQPCHGSGAGARISFEDLRLQMRETMDETATRAKRAPRARRAGPMPIARVAALLLAVGAAGVFNSAPAARAQQAQELPVVTGAKPVVREIVEDDEFVGRFDAV